MRMNQHKLVELNHATKQFIEAMILNRKQNLVSSFLGYEDLYDKLWLWKEKTTTSPSHLHLGH